VVVLLLLWFLLQHLAATDSAVNVTAAALTFTAAIAVKSQNVP